MAVCLTSSWDKQDSERYSGCCLALMMLLTVADVIGRAFAIDPRHVRGVTLFVLLPSGLRFHSPRGKGATCIWVPHRTHGQNSRMDAATQILCLFLLCSRVPTCSHGP
jgi:hypothetical protein